MFQITQMSKLFFTKTYSYYSDLSDITNCEKCPNLEFFWVIDFRSRTGHGILLGLFVPQIFKFFQKQLSFLLKGSST